MKLHVVLLISIFLFEYGLVSANIDPRNRKDCNPPCCVAGGSPTGNYTYTICSIQNMGCLVACMLRCTSQQVNGSSLELANNWYCHYEIFPSAPCVNRKGSNECHEITDPCESCYQIDICGISECIHSITTQRNQGKDCWFDIEIRSK